MNLSNITEKIVEKTDMKALENPRISYILGFCLSFLIINSDFLFRLFLIEDFSLIYEEYYTKTGRNEFYKLFIWPIVSAFFSPNIFSLMQLFALWVNSRLETLKTYFKIKHMVEEFKLHSKREELEVERILQKKENENKQELMKQKHDFEMKKNKFTEQVERKIRANISKEIYEKEKKMYQQPAIQKIKDEWKNFLELKDTKKRYDFVIDLITTLEQQRIDDRMAEQAEESSINQAEKEADDYDNELEAYGGTNPRIVKKTFFPDDE